MMLFELQQHGEFVVLPQRAFFQGRRAASQGLFPSPALEAGQHVLPPSLRFSRRFAAPALVQLDQQVFNHWVVNLQ